MQDEIKKHLKDILIAIDEIDTFFDSFPKRYEVFVDSLLLSGHTQLCYSWIRYIDGRYIVEHRY